MRSADRMTAAAAQQVDGAKEIAAVLVTRAGEWSAERLRTAADEMGNALLGKIQQEVAKAERASRTAVQVAWLIGGVGATALAGAAGFLIGGLGARVIVVDCGEAEGLWTPARSTSC